MNQQTMNSAIYASKVAREGDTKEVRLSFCTLLEVFRNGQWVCMKVV